MEAIRPCSICESNLKCDCQPSVLRFFELLQNANARVLSQKPTSPIQLPPRTITAGIDKIEGNLELYIDMPVVLEKAATYGIKITHAWLNKRKFLKATSDKGSIYLKPSLDKSVITQIISNPNEFDSWKEYYDFLTTILNPSVTERIKVTRLDLNIDFAIPFQSLIKQIDLPNKSTSHSHQSKSGQVTGLYIGKGAESLLIYDKSEEAGLKTPTTRIELKLRSKMLEKLYIDQIPKSLKSIRYFNYVSGLNAVIESNSPISENTNAKLLDFKRTLEREGFYSAKKAFNQSKNFKRDFENLISIRPWAIQPQELFEKHITPFLQKEKTWNQKTKDQ